MAETGNLSDLFLANIRKKNLLEPHHRVLLAVSGGKDSMAMMHLFRQSNFYCGTAHCNFKLRGVDADKDQQLVEEEAKKTGFPFFTISFDTADHASKKGISVQMAARELRYKWLEKIRSDHGFDVIATAHHLDDSIETLFINLIRGTGIAGLKGIPERAGYVIRPLLFASREAISFFVVNNQVHFREDATNEEEKYIRNMIRHQVVPKLKEINPSLTATLDHFFRHMTETEQINRWAVEMAASRCVQHDRDQIRINLDNLRHIKGFSVFLHEFLRGFGFAPDVSKSIAENPVRQPGRKFQSGTHTLLTDRDELLLFPTQAGNILQFTYIYNESGHCRFGNYLLQFDSYPISKGSLIRWPEKESTVFLDLEKLSFPLTLRYWQKGDRIKPLGMSGSKKISDLFVDKKIPLHKKTVIPILESDGEIAWVCGLKTSDSFKVDASTCRIFRIKLFPQENMSPEHDAD